MSDIKLWLMRGACSVAAHIALQEINAKYSFTKLSTKSLPDDFRRINPKLRVPVLSIDGEIITELPAILTAISYMSPEQNLLGSTDLEKIRTYEWMNWLSGTLHGQGFGGIWRPQRFSDDKNTFGSLSAKGLETVRDCFELIEQKLSGIHAVGGHFTVIDAYLFVFYRWGIQLGMNMKEDYPKYAALSLAVANRKSTKAVLQAEGLKSHF